MDIRTLALWPDYLIEARKRLMPIIITREYKQSAQLGARVGRPLCLMNSVCYDSWPVEAILQLGHPETRRRLSAWTATLLIKQALKMGFAASPSNDLLDRLDDEVCEYLLDFSAVAGRERNQVLFFLLGQLRVFNLRRREW